MHLPKHTWTVLITLTGIGMLVVAFLPRPVAVETAPVTRGTFQHTIDEDGKTRVRQRHTVSAPVAGTLQRIQLKAGDRVTPGMLLATIAPSAPALLDLRAEHELTERVGAAEATQRRATAEVARAQAVRDQAQADVQRTRQLAERGLVSRSQLEQADLACTTASRSLEAAIQAEHAAQHDVAVTRAALLQLRGEVAGAPEAQKLWQIASPIQGHVLRVLHESAGVVAAGTPLLELADAADLEVVVDVLTTDAVQMHPGTPVCIERLFTPPRLISLVWQMHPGTPVCIERWGRDQPLEGRVRVVEPGAFTKVSALGVEEQRVNVIIDMVSPFTQWQTLGDNYRVDARILVYSRDSVLKVPTSALFRERQQWMAFVVHHGRAQKRAVQVSRRNAVEAVVDTGVTEDDHVIVYPSDAIRDGVRVTEQ
jgi:HlyD family secretion protein